MFVYYGILIFVLKRTTANSVKVENKKLNIVAIVLPWATGPLTSLESIAKVPDRQVL